MAKTSKKVSKDYINELNQDFLREQYIDAPFTQIENRAQIIDLSKDLKPRVGVERIHCYQIVAVDKEYGPNGEPVFKPDGYIHENIRFVGPWINRNDGSGARADIDQDVNDAFIEVTFYGTGLVVLGYHDGSEWVYSVDGGAESTFINSLSGASTVQSGRISTPNTYVGKVSGLSLGVHTIKIRRNSGLSAGYFNVSGFDILNEREDLLVPQGDYYKNGQIFRNISEQNVTFDSGFENEYGTAGTKGGNVLVYLNNKGQIKKDIQYVDTTAQYLGSTDHSNEEIVTRYNWREFGLQRADDFSTYQSGLTDKGYHLSDGSTSLCANQILQLGDFDSVATDNTGGAFITLAFIGTGIDIISTRDPIGSGAYDVFIDGVEVGDITSGEGRIKVASGLPYGSHVMTIYTDGGSAPYLPIMGYDVYQPKKPTLPEDCVELANYNLMADFAVNSNISLDRVSTGVMRKLSTREFAYWQGTGGAINWEYSGPLPTSRPNAFEVRSDRGGAYFEYSFFGTGFDMVSATDPSVSTDCTVQLNGTDLTAANFPTASFATVGNQTYNDATASLNRGQALQQGGGFVVTGLPLGYYTVRVTNNVTGDTHPINSIDVITPVHVVQNIPYNVHQNNIRVGSNSISSSIKYKKQYSKKKVSVTKLVNNTAFSNGGFPGTPMGIVTQIELKEAKKLSINIFGGLNPANCQLVAVVNGDTSTELIPASRLTVEGTLVANLTRDFEAGTHVFQLFLRTLSGSPTAFGGRTYIRVEEVE